MVIKIDTVPFPYDETMDDDQKKTEKRVAQAAKKRRQLAKALILANGFDAIQASQHAFVGSAYVRFTAMIEVAKELPYGERKKVSEYFQMASDLKPWEPIHEPVYLRAKKKSDGTYRYYFDFGIRNKTAQLIAAAMMRPLFQPAPFQCDVAGRGVSYAIALARKYIEQGYRHGLHLDIKKYFDSFNHDAILGPAISMTKDFKSAVLTGKHYEVKYASTSVLKDVLTQYASQVASAGIPQGSSVSSLVAAFFMSKLDVGKLPEDVVVLNYVDDFLLLAKVASSLETGSYALQSALTDLSAGDFLLLPKDVGTPQQFTFLGNRFHIATDGALTVTVLEAAFDVFVERYEQKIAALSSSIKKMVKASTDTEKVAGDILMLLQELVRWLKSWLLAYREADDIAEYESYWKARFGAFAHENGVNYGEELWGITKQKKPMQYLFGPFS